MADELNQLGTLSLGQVSRVLPKKEGEQRRNGKFEAQLKEDDEEKSDGVVESHQNKNPKREASKRTKTTARKGKLLDYQA